VVGKRFGADVKLSVMKPVNRNAQGGPTGLGAPRADDPGFGDLADGAKPLLPSGFGQEGCPVDGGECVLKRGFNESRINRSHYFWHLSFLFDFN
jgi:hypothetical protein